MDEELRHTQDEKQKTEQKKENYIEKISESSMKRIDGQISTHKADNVFSSRNQSKDLMLSGEKDHLKKELDQPESITSKISGKFYSRKDTESFPKTNQHQFNETKNISSAGNVVDNSTYFEFEIRGIDKIRNIDSEEL